MRIPKPLTPSEAQRVKTLGAQNILATSIVDVLDQRKAPQMARLKGQSPKEIADGLCKTIRAYFENLEDETESPD